MGNTGGSRKSELLCLLRHKVRIDNLNCRQDELSESCVRWRTMQLSLTHLNIQFVSAAWKSQECPELGSQTLVLETCESSAWRQKKDPPFTIG